MSTSSLASLPDEVLKLVMQHVPLQHRLGSCCLVSRRLHAAAVAATDRVCVRESRWTSGFEWLLHYGHHVTDLGFVNTSHPLGHIPCPNLLKLRCLNSRVQLGPAADGSLGVIQGCTKLTRLELYCTADDIRADAVLDSLSRLVHLESLDVLASDPIVLSRGTFPCLTRLTSLDLSDLADAESLAELGSLTSLQHLAFYGGRGDDSIAIGPSSVPGLVFPASLTQLSLGAKVEARLLSLVPEGLRSLRVSGIVEGPAEGPGSFLCCIARLQHLTELMIEADGRIAWPPPGPAYSALTASSNLKFLCLCGSQPPVGVWSHVFPAARKLPHLTFVTFYDETSDLEWASPPPAWGAADISSLVSCCPNLCDIGDGLYMQPGQHVSELHKLTALTHLNVTYRPCDLPAVRESMQGLGAVTQLRRLSVEVLGMHDGPAASLLPLTNLTALTNLWCPCVRETIRDDLEGRMHYTQQADWDIPVWVRLLRLCADSNSQARDQLAQLLADPAAVALHRAVTLDQDMQLSMQLSTQREQIATQRDAFEQQLATLQGSSEQQDALVAVLRGQLAAQREAVAEQAVQIAGLQGEVAAQKQAAAQQQQLVVQQQQVVAQQGAQIAGLQGQLQSMQAVLQGLLQRQLQ